MLFSSSFFSELHQTIANTETERSGPTGEGIERIQGAETIHGRYRKMWKSLGAGLFERPCLKVGLILRHGGSVFRKGTGKSI